MNYSIEAGNIEYVALGTHASVFERIRRFPGQYSLIKKRQSEMEVFLLRAPTPLVLLLYFLKRRVRVVLYLVGSYVEGSKDLKFSFLKRMLIRLFSWCVEFCQSRMVVGASFIANSQPLLNQFSKTARNAYLIKTTTLRSDFFWERTSPLLGRPLKVLFTGRIDESKGLVEIVDACKILANQLDVEFHFAGLVIKGKESLPNFLIERARGTRLEGKIFFHGLKSVGQELNSLYRSCDVYVMASKSDFEGFPRTIWEAMANSVPVVASSVGSIPVFLRNGIDAVLIRNVSAEAIAEKVLHLHNNPETYNRLMRNGLLLAKENTLEVQAKRLKSALTTIVNEKI